MTIMEESGDIIQNIEVEIVLQKKSNVDKKYIEKLVDDWLRRKEHVPNGILLKQFSEDVNCQILSNNIEYVKVCEDRTATTHLPSVNISYKCYKLVTLGPELEEICQEGEEEIPAAQHWILPNIEFQGVWENLIYDTDIKRELLRFVSTSILLSDRGVDTGIVTCNRVVLLHGPPGTGKTSLCHAIAQKLSIRLQDRYKSTHLVEINSHSLFSKWFSESGKLVQKMFTEIKRLMEDSRALICVLIDEVESLTAARKNAMSGSEPSDAIRVVNALLTQLDSIKNASNVLILTTSNITGAIDLAFVDRADIKQYVGHPSQAAVYQILHSCLQELSRAGVVMDTRGEPCLSYRQLQLAGLQETPGGATKSSRQLWSVAGKCRGLSGRSIRKIAFLALALFSSASDRGSVPLSEFLVSLDKAVDRQIKDREELTKDVSDMKLK